MEKERSPFKWTSDETNIFYEILAHPVNTFIETLERWTLKKHSGVKNLIPLLLHLKKVWNVFSSKKKIKSFKAKRKETKLVCLSRSISSKNLVIWHQKYSDDPFLSLTFRSHFCISFDCNCLLFFVTLALSEVNNEPQKYCKIL